MILALWLTMPLLLIGINAQAHPAAQTMPLEDRLRLEVDQLYAKSSVQRQSSVIDFKILSSVMVSPGMRTFIYKIVIAETEYYQSPSQTEILAEARYYWRGLDWKLTSIQLKTEEIKFTEGSTLSSQIQ